MVDVVVGVAGAMMVTKKIILGGFSGQGGSGCIRSTISEVGKARGSLFADKKH